MQLFHGKTHTNDAEKIDEMIVANRVTLDVVQVIAAIQSSAITVIVPLERCKENTRLLSRARHVLRTTFVLEKSGWLMVATPPFAANGGVVATSFSSYAAGFTVSETESLT